MDTETLLLTMAADDDDARADAVRTIWSRLQAIQRGDDEICLIIPALEDDDQWQWRMWEVLRPHPTLAGWALFDPDNGEGSVHVVHPSAWGEYAPRNRLDW